MTSTDPRLIVLHPNDDVAICRAQLVGGTLIGDLTIRGLIPGGHKVARHGIAAGAPVRRYNQIIGISSCVIGAGEHVHTHNLAMGDFSRDFAFGADLKPAPAPRRAQFMGIVRPDGRIATRNYIGILSSVNCATTVARAIADHMNSTVLQAYPNIDGVVALSHSAGCGMDDSGLGMQVLQRTLSGYALHANFAAVLVVGLGCEANQIPTMMRAAGMAQGSAFQTFNIQDVGGTSKAVARGIEIVQQFLPQANAATRTPCEDRKSVV